MKKLMLMTAMILLTGMASFSQVFNEGSHVINVGIGFGNTAYFGSYYSGFIPSMSGSYEYGIVEIPMGSQLRGVVSAGAYIGWSASQYGDWGDDHYNVSDLIIAGRGNYHFIFHDKLDTYAGLLIGADIVRYTWKGDGIDPDVTPASNGLAFGVYVGGRWYFTDHFSAYAELGYLISVFNVGVSFKIK